MYQISWNFLNENKDIRKLRIRQESFFVDYNLKDKTTVAGLLSISMDEGGDYVPVHILSILAEACREGLDSNEDNLVPAVPSTVDKVYSLSSFKNNICNFLCFLDRRE
jgi:hypothetical protein